MYSAAIAVLWTDRKKVQGIVNILCWHAKGRPSCLMNPCFHIALHQFSFVIFCLGQKAYFVLFGVLPCLVAFVHCFCIFSGSLQRKWLSHHSLGFEIGIIPILAIAVIFKTALVCFPS